MKKTRVLINLILIAVLGSVVLAAPAPAFAVGEQMVVAASGAAQLVVENRTGGTLYVSLSGPKAYYFSADRRGATTFKDIEVGKYTITVTSSACPGSLSYQKNLKGSVSLKGFKCVNQSLGTIDQQVVTLTIDNRAPGTLYITLKGPAVYSFSISKGGLTTFRNIVPGNYEITVRSSACSGSFVTRVKLIGHFRMPKYFYCKK